MNLEDYRVLFIVVTLGLTLIVASPLLEVMLSLRGSSEKFSELSLLGPWRKAEGYPFNVVEGEKYTVFVNVSNHMGRSEYHLVYAKFRNRTQPLPDINNSVPSPLPPLYEFRFFVAHNETWESRVTFAFQDVAFLGDHVSVGNVTINDVAFSVDSSSMWDSENSGFYFQLFFELWRYDMEGQSFRFHNRFVSIWLNMTGP